MGAGVIWDTQPTNIPRSRIREVYEVLPSPKARQWVERSLPHAATAPLMYVIVCQTQRDLTDARNCFSSAPEAVSVSKSGVWTESDPGTTPKYL